MSITTLISSIDRTTTYPVTQSGSAPSNTGLLCLTLTNTWTEQMLAELPTIEVNVYMPDGTRLITISIDMRTVNDNTHTATEPYAIPLYNLPETFDFSITPLFDEFAIQSHNAQIETGDFTSFNTSETGIVDTNPQDYTGLLWTTPTSNFEVDILWNDTNVAAGGIDVDSEITPGSDNPPSSDAVYNYVNNAVSTNTANFIGTFSSVSELEAYSGAVSNNDYAFVIREYTLLESQPDDWTDNYTNYFTKSTGAPTWVVNKYYSKSGDTYTLTTSQPSNWTTNYSDYYTLFNETEYRSVVGVDTYTAIPSGTAPTFAQNTYYAKETTYYDRYKYNVDTNVWGYEYSLEFTQLTPEQQATLNSGITAADKVVWDAKQDALTPGTGIDITSDTISIKDIDGLTAGEKALYQISFNQQGQITSAEEITSFTLNCESDGLDGTPETYFNTMKAYFDKNNANSMTPQQLTDLCEQWYLFTRENWNGWTTFEETGVSTGTKGGDNYGLTCEPSTNTVKGQDDYAGLPLFYPIDVNFIVDYKGDVLITGINGITTSFERNNPNKFVGVMQQSGYHWESHTSNTYTHGYSSNPVEGKDYCNALPECFHRDNTFQQFMVHSKYMGTVVNNKLCSYSGAIPTCWIGVDNSHTYAQAQGTQYGAESITQRGFLYLMTMIKYGSMTLDNIIQGCVNYNFQYPASVSETGVKRVLLTSAQASNLEIGSGVLIGTVGSNNNVDRNTASVYNVTGQAGAIITKIEDVTVSGTTYKGVYVENISSAFNTTGGGSLTTGTTVISTFMWPSGSNDSILGNDGSLKSPGSGKYPAKLQGIEYSTGCYETYGDIITNVFAPNTTHTNSYYKFYVVNDPTKRVTSGNYTSNYIDLGIELEKSASTAGWNYIVKNSFQGGICIPSNMIGGSSTTYTKDAFYGVANVSTTGRYSLRAFGTLGSGVAGGGLSCLLGSTALGFRYWHLGARLSAGAFWNADAFQEMP